MNIMCTLKIRCAIEEKETHTWTVHTSMDVRTFEKRFVFIIVCSRYNGIICIDCMLHIKRDLCKIYRYFLSFRFLFRFPLMYSQFIYACTCSLNSIWWSIHQKKIRAKNQLNSCSSCALTYMREEENYIYV